MSGSLLLAADTFVWGVQGICRLHLLPCNPKLVLQQFAPPYDILSLQQAATALGLRSGLREVEASALSELPVPFVAVLNAEEASQPSRLALVIRCDERVVTFLEQGRQHSTTRTIAELGAQFAGMVMLCAPAVIKHRGEEEGEEEPKEFGFQWFVPELLRHKPIWRDVLLASLAIQLMALATASCETSWSRKEMRSAKDNRWFAWIPGFRRQMATS